MKKDRQFLPLIWTVIFDQKWYETEREFSFSKTEDILQKPFD
jgi:hypothetical protein